MLMLLVGVVDSSCAVEVEGRKYDESKSRSSMQLKRDPRVSHNYLDKMHEHQFIKL